MNFDDAIKTHVVWKINLRAAIDAKAELDATSIGKHNACVLGLWLQDDAQERYFQLPSYWACAIAHTEFHCEAEKIANLINAKKFSEANAAMSFDSPYDIASRKVTAAIKAFRDEAQLLETC